ncbi:hypothetical protein OAB48_00590 [Pelagibacteraceae bacterium]|nr:hypothetical protein [Pelagibacteraceae bacterium]
MSLQSIKIYNQLANHKLFNKSINFDLKRIKLVLKKLGNPEKKLINVINILGSDGKYSLLTSLKYFIEANGQTTSAYISPSLKSIKDRFWLGNRYINYAEIKKTIKLIEKQKIPLTIFEVLTVIYILNLTNRNNNYNLIEAGALFAKDSTNIFKFPLIQAVVNINKQHLNFLKKKTLNEVIYQKVGFLNNYTNIYIGQQRAKTQKKIKFFLRKNMSRKIYSKSWKIIKDRNCYFYKDNWNKIKLNTKFIFSEGLIKNLAMAVKIALDLKINKKIIQKTIPNIIFEGRIQYINKGKLKKYLNKKEKILIDGCHSKTSAKNFSSYLKSIKTKKFGIWGMTKNKNPEIFIKQFKNRFEKIIAVPIEGEKNSVSNKYLMKLAKDNNIRSETAKNFKDAIKKISSKEEKIICIFGSLYLCGNVLNKN